VLEAAGATTGVAVAEVAPLSPEPALDSVLDSLPFEASEEDAPAVSADFAPPLPA